MTNFLFNALKTIDVTAALPRLLYRSAAPATYRSGNCSIDISRRCGIFAGEFMSIGSCLGASFHTCHQYPLIFKCGVKPCAEGQPGYIITRGGHVMQSYVGQVEMTAKATSDDGWYLKLGDIGFYLLSNDGSGNKDFYWFVLACLH